MPLSLVWIARIAYRQARSASFELHRPSAQAFSDFSIPSGLRVEGWQRLGWNNIHLRGGKNFAPYQFLLTVGRAFLPHCNRNEKMRGISGRGLEINSHSRPGGWGVGAPARACARSRLFDITHPLFGPAGSWAGGPRPAR